MTGFFGIGAYSDITEILIPSYRKVYIGKETYATEGYFIIRKI